MSYDADRLVSVIMPAYNAEKYIEEAVQSVLDQGYQNFELLIINDGSTDKTKEIIHSFSDERIRYFEQKNKGVSAARNIGLKNHVGEYICFLDSDDKLTSNSIESRIAIFADRSDIWFVDGVVDHNLSNELHTWIPDFNGNPLKDLLKITGKSFFGPSWMLKSSHVKGVLFCTEMTHFEDLLYYIQCAKSLGTYAFTSETVLLHREHEKSVMSNLDGLEKSAVVMLGKLECLGLDRNLLFSFRLRILRILGFSYLKKLNLLGFCRVAIATMK